MNANATTGTAKERFHGGDASPFSLACVFPFRPSNPDKRATSARGGAAMIHQTTKDLYYLLLHPISKLLRPLYRLRYSTRKPTKIHIGCGNNYLAGFVNIDANFQRKVDCLLDVRVGLPFSNDSIEFIYSCHMMEHLHIDEMIALLKECKRVLSPTGYMRLTLPDFEYALRIAAEGRGEKFPRPFKSAHGQAINFLFCDGQHKYAFSSEVLREIASDIGFSRVVDVNSDANFPDEPIGSFSVNLFK